MSVAAIVAAVAAPHDAASSLLAARWSKQVKLGTRNATYHEYLSSCEVAALDADNVEAELAVMEKDIKRTTFGSFKQPSLRAFFGKGGSQEQASAALERVLVAFLRRHRRIGYVQGLNHVRMPLSCRGGVVA